jgi:hypothetical protein
VPRSESSVVDSLLAQPAAGDGLGLFPLCKIEDGTVAIAALLARPPRVGPLALDLFQTFGANASGGAVADIRSNPALPGISKPGLVDRLVRAKFSLAAGALHALPITESEEMYILFIGNGSSRRVGGMAASARDSGGDSSAPLDAAAFAAALAPRRRRTVERAAKTFV